MQFIKDADKYYAFEKALRKSFDMLSLKPCLDKGLVKKAFLNKVSNLISNKEASVSDFIIFLRFAVAKDIIISCMHNERYLEILSDMSRNPENYEVVTDDELSEFFKVLPSKEKGFSSFLLWYVPDKILDSYIEEYRIFRKNKRFYSQLLADKKYSKSFLLISYSAVLSGFYLFLYFYNSIILHFLFALKHIGVIGYIIFFTLFLIMSLFLGSGIYRLALNITSSSSASNKSPLKKLSFLVLINIPLAFLINYFVLGVTGIGEKLHVVINMAKFTESHSHFAHLLAAEVSYLIFFALLCVFCVFIYEGAKPFITKNESVKEGRMIYTLLMSFYISYLPETLKSKVDLRRKKWAITKRFYSRE